MKSKKIYYGLVGLCVVLFIGLAGSVYFGLGVLQDSSEELKQAKIEREVVSNQELSLLQAINEIEEFSELEQVARNVIPQEKDQARTVREIISIANRSGVNINSISFPASDLGEDDENVISQARPVPGMQGLFELDLSVQITQDASFNQFISFLEGLEQNRRTSQVTSVSITPDQNERGQVSFSINLGVFIRP